MLKWLATKFEARRAALQARLESSLRAKVAGEESRVEASEWRKRGNACLGAGQLADAEACYRRGIETDPTDAICYSNLGYALFEQGRRTEAEAALENAVRLNPSDSDAYYMLGNMARDREERLRAIVCYRTALRINPNFDFCRRDLCVALAQSGRIQEAQVVMDQGPSFDTDTATYHFFKGNLHLAAEQLQEASACFSEAARLSPQDAMIWLNLCVAQLKRNDVFAALNTGHRILEIEPDNAQAYGLLAVANQFTGQYDLTVEYYRKALQLDSQYLHLHQNLLFALTYVPGYPGHDYLREARAYGAKISGLAKPYSSWLCTAPAQTTRPLRVGFVSGDFRFHPVGMFLKNVLPFLDPARMSCIAYSNWVGSDAFTAQLKPLFSEWNEVANMSDEVLAEKIHHDKIDVLVDLAGHTGLNRLAVFAWCAAPVQVSWLGYWAGTGVAEMDYLLVDDVSVHEDEARFYSERLWFLPDTRLCFSPPATQQRIEVSPVPAVAKGYVTFGSFQTLSKVTDSTLAAWSQILAQLPTARLRLLSKPFEYPESVAHMKKRLALAKIDADRVDLLSGTSWEGYLATYAEVDMVLDTFPFPGGTTTAEALWMGVPTVTLTGSTMVGRQGESMLRCVGLDDWVAASEGEYIRIALKKAADLPALAALRARLRAAALASPLFDGKRFANNLEKALDGMFKAKLT